MAHRPITVRVCVGQDSEKTKKNRCWILKTASKRKLQCAELGDESKLRLLCYSFHLNFTALLLEEIQLKVLYMTKTQMKNKKVRNQMIW